MKKFRQILCILGVVLLLALYVLTFIFSLTDSTQAKSWLSASLYATFAVPIFLYAVMLVTKFVKGKGAPDQADAPSDKNK